MLYYGAFMVYSCGFCFSQLFKILEMNPEDEAEEDGANIDLDSQRKGKCVVLKTSTRQVRNFFVYSCSS